MTGEAGCRAAPPLPSLPPMDLQVMSHLREGQGYGQDSKCCLQASARWSAGGLWQVLLRKVVASEQKCSCRCCAPFVIVSSSTEDGLYMKAHVADGVLACCIQQVWTKFCSKAGVWQTLHS